MNEKALLLLEEVTVPVPQVIEVLLVYGRTVQAALRLQ